MKNVILENQTTTSNSKQIALLKQHFPGCFDKDGQFLAEKMAEIVGAEGLDVAHENYTLTWLGKSYARLLANLNAETLLSANKEHNGKPQNEASENLLIQGDNLEVLKHLKSAYDEQIKMIYIDPPYNTGSDGFVYQDNRKFSPEELAELAAIEEAEARRVLEFTHSNSNSHSAWLTFLYPRLYVAKALLSEESVIFISIDDNEKAQLKLLCDEIFGEENFVACLPTIMNLKGNQDAFGFSDTHEYVVVYARNKEACEIGHFDVSEEEIEKEWEEDDHGLFKRADTLRRTGQDASRKRRPKGWFPVFISMDETVYVTDDDKPKESTDLVLYPVNDEGDELSWSWGKKKIKSEPHNLIVIDGRNGKNIYKKQRPALGDLPTAKPKSIFYKPEYSTSTATTELRKLMGAKTFDGPKPVPFLIDLLTIGTDKNSTCLDFFAGSGTTAHAVMALNASDDGNRKFIAVQLDEPTDADSSAREAGYENIFEITRERILRAAERTKAEWPDATCDFGFKEFKTVPVFEGYLDAADTPDQFSIFEGDKLSQEQREQLLLTWQVYDGLPLNLDLEPIDLNGYEAYQGNHILYFINSSLDLKHAVAMLERIDSEPSFAPQKIVIFESVLSSKAKREISEAIKGYNNQKQIDLHLEVRF